MKWIGLFGMLLMALIGQGQSQLSDFIQSYEITSSANQINTRLEKHLNDLKIRKEKFTADEAYLAEVFDYTHRKLLRSYVPYSQFNELMERGRYDCLSATALFSVLFTELGFHYQIIETNYHIFMMVDTARGSVLIETTDRFNGLVKGSDQIAARIKGYQQNQLISSNKNFYAYQATIYQQVSADHLIGLLYFNQAVRHYNNQQWELCGEKLDAAMTRYPSPRAEELAVILFHSVQASQLSAEVKSRMSERYQKYLQTVRPVLAVR